MNDFCLHKEAFVEKPPHFVIQVKGSSGVFVALHTLCME